MTLTTSLSFDGSLVPKTLSARTRNVYCVFASKFCMLVNACLHVSAVFHCVVPTLQPMHLNYASKNDTYRHISTV